MTSTNSSAKFLPMLKNVFKRNIAYVILMTLFSTFCTTVAVGIVISESRYYGKNEIFDVTMAYSTGLSAVLMVLFFTGSFVMGAVLYREIYSKRACDFYFSMPVTRGVYFNCNMLFCIITAAISYVLQTVITIVSISGVKNCTFDASEFLKRMLIAFLATLAVTAIFMLCAVTAGKLVHYIVLSYIAIIVVGTALAGAIDYINTIWGMWLDPTYEWLLSPLAGAFNIAEELNAKLLISVCAALIAQFAAAYAAGYTVFKKRKAEIAEFTVAGKIMPAAIIVISVISDFAVSLSMETKSVFVNIIIGIISATVSTLILTAIFYKKAFTKATAACLIGASAVSLIFAAGIELVPSIRYVNYIPEIGEVESVTLDENLEMDTINSLVSFLPEYYNYWDDDYPPKTFSSDDAKQKVYDLHAKLIDEKTISNAHSYNNYYYDNGTHSLRLTYKLKNGKTVKRAYCVVSQDIFDEYIALMKTDESLDQVESLNIPDEDVLFIEISRYDTYYDDYDYYDYDRTDSTYSDDGYAPTYLTLDEYSTLFEKVKADRKNESDKMFYNFECSNFYVYSIYADYMDLAISIYTYSEDATEEDKEKLSTMTPEEMLNYQESVAKKTNYERWILDEQFISINRYADTETMQYLEANGYIAD